MNIKLNLEDKMLNPGVINLRQFTSGTDTLVFLMPDYIYETTNLSKLDCYAICDMPVTEEDYRINETKLATEIVEDVLQITWNITGYTTAKEGTITYQIVFKDKTNEQTKIWLSDKAIIFVNSSVNVDGMLPAMFPDILMQWEERMKQTDSDSISNLEETIKQVNLAKEEVSKAEAQVNLAKQEVTKATEQAELATAEANRSKQEADKSKEQADKAELIKSNVEQLVGYDPVDAIGQEVMQARGVHNLLGDRLTSIETDVMDVDEKYTTLQEAISTLSTFKKEIVDILPTENIDTDTIYFVPKTESENDSYDEYIFINSKWEHIGSTAIDLSDYYTKAETNEIANFKLKNYDADSTETGLLETLTVAYKDQVKDNGNYDTIEKKFAINLANVADGYNLMGLEKIGYYVTLHQHPRSASNVYFNFTNMYNQSMTYSIELKTDASDNVLILNDSVVKKVENIIDGTINSDIVLGRRKAIKLATEGLSSSTYQDPVNIAKVETWGAGNLVKVFGDSHFDTVFRIAQNDRIHVLEGDVDISTINDAKKLAYTDEIVASETVKNIRTLTLAQYNALTTKDTSTLYLIMG